MVGDRFYAYIYPKNLVEFAAPKLMTAEIALGCQMTLDTEGEMYHTTKVYSFVFSASVDEPLDYFLGVLNSRVLWFFIKNTGYVLRGGYYTFKTDYLSPFPIPSSKSKRPPSPEFVSAVEKAARDVRLAKKADPEADTKEAEHEIDRLVYKLYGLSKKEIAVLEADTPEMA